MLTKLTSVDNLFEWQLRPQSGESMSGKNLGEKARALSVCLARLACPAMAAEALSLFIKKKNKATAAIERGKPGARRPQSDKAHIYGDTILSENTLTKNYL